MGSVYLLHLREVVGWRQFVQGDYKGGTGNVNLHLFNRMCEYQLKIGQIRDRGRVNSQEAQGAMYKVT